MICAHLLKIVAAKARSAPRVWRDDGLQLVNRDDPLSTSVRMGCDWCPPSIAASMMTSSAARQWPWSPRARRRGWISSSRWWHGADDGLQYSLSMATISSSTKARMYNTFSSAAADDGLQCSWLMATIPLSTKARGWIVPSQWDKAPQAPGRRSHSVILEHGDEDGLRLLDGNDPLEHCSENGHGLLINDIRLWAYGREE